MPCYSSHQFYKEYELAVDKEFEYDGKKAEWTANDNGPRFWGDEDESIVLRRTDPLKGNVPSSAAALTSDSRFLAVSTNAVIRIHDVDSLVVTAELVGHEGNVRQLHFVDHDATSSRDQDVRYTLLSDGSSVGGMDGHVFAWSIDSEGRLLAEQARMPFAVQSLSDRAVGAISQDLVVHHELSVREVDTLRDHFAAALTTADTENRAKVVPKVHGHFPSFGSTVVSHDRTAVLHIDHGNSTQSGMRPPDELPQIIVRDVPTLRERCRLRGHEDAIMWAAWSLDDRLVATACWDATYKIWDAETGECKHTIGKTDGQNWAGAFLPDGKHIILSGGARFGVYELETAREVAHLSPDESIKLDNWLRYFEVNPVGDNLLALQNALALLAWKPLEELGAGSASERSEVQEIFAFRPWGDWIKSSYQRIFPVAWVDNGNKLLAKSSESTTFVWDRERNTKWRFQRPKGVMIDGECTSFFVKRKGAEWVIVLDEDGVVRFWKL